MKKIASFLFVVIIISLFGFSSNNPQKPYDEIISERVDSVLSLMTLEDKIGQLNQLSFGIGWGPTVKIAVPDEYKDLIRQGKIGSFLNAVGAEFTYELQKVAVNESKLKIPLIFGLDVIHGFKTTFPVPLGEAATWQPEIIEMSAHYQAMEAASAGIHWTFSPMVDIARDPRWGRIVEGSGEDPYLGSLMAAARVRGYQENLSDLNIIACAKHYAAYGGAEGGRDYNTVDISERTLRDVYLPPYKAAVDAGVYTLMASFNEIGGIPSSGNKYLLTDILRNEWGFKGFVVSDWGSIGEMINHGFASDLKHAGEISINAGLDMDM
jgi:beta-glucosidase